jgi:methyl coenzyme M reductase subunit D
MEPIPLPSHIHYELLLQLLERQTMHAVNSKSGVQDQVQQLIITLRKALSQQKHLEETCERLQLPIDYRWSLNSPENKNSTSKDFLSLGQEQVGTQ